MDRRGFLCRLPLAALGLLQVPSAGASLLPANPVFGRSFKDLQGREVALSGYRGQPVLMNFWASWCGPCVREMPLLESLHQRHADLVLLGLAIDSASNVQQFLQRVPVSYPVLLTGTQGIALMRELGNPAGALPFSVFFNRNGASSETVIGELKEDRVAAQLRKIL